MTGNGILRRDVTWAENSAMRWVSAKTPLPILLATRYSLAMWDAWLKNDPAAKQWLHDAGDLRDGDQQAKISRK